MDKNKANELEEQMANMWLAIAHLKEAVKSLLQYTSLVDRRLERVEDQNLCVSACCSQDKKTQGN